MSESTPGWEERAAARAITPASGVRTNRYIAASNAVIVAGLALIGENGSAGFTVQDIASRAEISLHTFYRLFPTKDDLFLAILEFSCSEDSNKLAEIARQMDSPLDALQLAITAPFLSERYDREFGLFIVHEEHRLSQTRPTEVGRAFKPMRQLIADRIAVARDAGLVKSENPDADAEVIQLVQMAMFHIKAQAIETALDRAPHDVLWDIAQAILSPNRDDRVAVSNDLGPWAD